MSVYNKNIYKPKLKMPLIPSVLLVLVVIFGTLGYMWIWRDIKSASFIDALYMTIITITTLGYAEIFQLGHIGRIFTMFIAIIGIGSMFYILGTLMENLFILQLDNYRGKRKMQKKIDELYDHIIVIGLGRVGKRAVNELKEKQEHFVVIDNKITDEKSSETSNQFNCIKGDATDDGTLVSAGITRARALMVTTANSATTVFVVLSAKVLNPDIFIVARCDNDNDIEKLIRAGANRVINPYAIGGQRLANILVNPNVVDFFETSLGSKEQSINIENIQLPGNSIWHGKTIIDMNLRHKTGATIIALMRDNKAITELDSNMKLLEDDILLTLGTKSQLVKAYSIILDTE
jgi:voltage-gated potassium channel